MVSAEKMRAKKEERNKKRAKKHLREIKKEIKGYTDEEEMLYSFYSDTPKAVIKRVKKKLEKQGYNVTKRKFNGHVVIEVYW